MSQKSFFLIHQETSFSSQEMFLFQAIIVGYHTRKVLYIDVKNKYCTLCAMAHMKNESVQPHTCYKNWNVIMQYGNYDHYRWVQYQ